MRGQPPEIRRTVRQAKSRPLVEDNSVRSRATSLVNLEAGYTLTKQLRIAVDVFNLLDAPDNDIEYFYTSRLPGEPLSGVADIHFHPALKRTARVSVSVVISVPPCTTTTSRSPITGKCCRIDSATFSA